MKGIRGVVAVAAAVVLLAASAPVWAAGDSCSDAIVLGIGKTSGQLGASGTAWYRFTPADTGSSFVTSHRPETDFRGSLTVYGSCGGQAMVHDEGMFPLRNAYVNWFATGGTTYYVRVAKIDGTGSGFGLTVNSPEGGDPACAPGAGNCHLDTGTPGCDDTMCGGDACTGPCCATICAADAFCCDTTWDQICADAAIAEPVNCGTVPVELQSFSVE